VNTSSPTANAQPASAPLSAIPPEEIALIERLRNGDEAAFVTLVGQHHKSLLHVARGYVSDQAVAEEVVQETWLGVLRGLQNFEGRCSLKTWIFQILVNRARTRGQRESRTVAFSSLAVAELEDSRPAVDPSRFAGPNADYPDHWSTAPQQWDLTPEQMVLSSECRALLEKAIAALPPVQRQVITLRDIHGWDSPEVCNALGITETNCRVLLHRARSRVRQAMEDYLGR
jgi:RNA polymerase sigma-70 factor (ECF subfamily)